MFKGELGDEFARSEVSSTKVGGVAKPKRIGVMICRRKRKEYKGKMNRTSEELGQIDQAVILQRGYKHK